MRRRAWLPWVLTLHRLSAALLGAALLLYAVTGALLAYGQPASGDWADAWQEQTTRLPLPAADDPEQALRALARRLDPRARVERLRRDAGGLRLELERPGRQTELVLAPSAEEVRVRTRIPNLAARAGELHDQRGFRGGAAFVLWATLADATGVALLLFAGSGVLLAWRRDPLRTLWTLGSSSLLTAAIVLHLWLSR